MRLFSFALIILIAACAPIRDTRTPEQASATRTAKPIQPLYEPVLRIVLERPPINIAPAIAPNEASLLPTITPQPAKASE